MDQATSVSSSIPTRTTRYSVITHKVILGTVLFPSTGESPQLLLLVVVVLPAGTSLERRRIIPSPPGKQATRCTFLLLLPLAQPAVIVACNTLPSYVVVVLLEKYYNNGSFAYSHVCDFLERKKSPHGINSIQTCKRYFAFHGFQKYVVLHT